MGGGQELPPCRRSSLHPGQGFRSRQPRGQLRSAAPVFSETGDAWLLDVSDRLALRLARDGDPDPIHLEETDASFAIEWKGQYRIDGPAFIYTDRASGRMTTILGYPTQVIAREISNMFG